jgi:hypothetical protein
MAFLRLDRVRKFLTQLRPLLECVAVTRPQLAVMPIDVRQSAKPVVLHRRRVAMAADLVAVSGANLAGEAPALLDRRPYSAHRAP